MNAYPEIVFFNNRKRFDHAVEYGQGAFFDLGRRGPQRKMARGLPVGQRCVVFSPTPDSKVQFAHYLFERETIRGAERVLRGRHVRTQTISRDSAIRHPDYAVVFNVNGHFKRPSVIVPTKAKATAFRFPEEVELEDGPLNDGRVRQITVNAYERNPKARRRCIQHHKARCAVCGVNLADVYGAVAEGFIHVHHLKPLASVGKQHKLNPVEDLRPVCPNCHAIIHLGGCTRSLDEVRGLLQTSKRKR